MVIKKSNEQHEVAYQEMLALIGRHKDSVSGVEMLAIGANLVGKLIAMQNPQVLTPKQAMNIVAKNIQIGNVQATEEMAKKRYN